MIDRLRLWWKKRSLVNAANGLKRSLAATSQKIARVDERFKQARIQAEISSNALQVELETLKEDIAEYERAQKRYEAENEALRTKVSILEKIAIPGLTQSNQVLLERLDAMTALEIRKQVAFKDHE